MTIYGKILNLTQHVATPEQIEAGVFEPSAEDKQMIQKLLTFEEIPIEITPKENVLGYSEMEDRAKKLAAIGKKYGVRKAMIGGAPYFMHTLEYYMIQMCVFPVYSFSKRESVDQIQPDGSVRKVAVFKHCGFVEV